MLLGSRRAVRVGARLRKALEPISSMRKPEIERLESIGVEAVLLEISQGMHGQPTSQMREEVEAWLRSKRIAADAAASARRDAREEETLSIAYSVDRDR